MYCYILINRNKIINLVVCVWFMFFNSIQQNGDVSPENKMFEVV